MTDYSDFSRYRTFNQILNLDSQRRKDALINFLNYIKEIIPSSELEGAFSERFIDVLDYMQSFRRFVDHHYSLIPYFEIEEDLDVYLGLRIMNHDLRNWSIISMNNEQEFKNYFDSIASRYFLAEHALRSMAYLITKDDSFLSRSKSHLDKLVDSILLFKHVNVDIQDEELDSSQIYSLYQLLKNSVYFTENYWEGMYASIDDKGVSFMDKIDFIDYMTRIEIKTIKNSRNLLFWVEDNGPGIPLENASKIFHGYSDKFEGGVGLDIVRRLCELRHHELGLKSKHLDEIPYYYSPFSNTFDHADWDKDHGSRFSLKLPYKLNK